MSIVKTLLADDHALVRAGLRDALASLSGIEIVGEVGNGHDLMEALESLRPDLPLAVQRILDGGRWISDPLVDRLVGYQSTAADSSSVLTRRQRELLYM